jgi:F0F1-type ATP synthase assembly protein I
MATLIVVLLSLLLLAVVGAGLIWALSALCGFLSALLPSNATPSDL